MTPAAPAPMTSPIRPALSLGTPPFTAGRIAEHAPHAVARVRLADLAPYDGAPSAPYARAVELLSDSLTRRNAAVIEIGGDEAAVVHCALESSRFFFRSRAGKSGRGFHVYHAGRSIEDGDASPPCMSEAFRCLGMVARAALCAIARHLRLRSDAFTHLLDDHPLPANEVSSSVLVVTHSHSSIQNCKVSIGGGKSAANEVEKGLLTVIASDNPGVQVCDPNGRWYQADGTFGPGDLLLLTGKALSHATAGLRPSASYRAVTDIFNGVVNGERTSLMFRLMPHNNAVLDCSPIAAAGHIIPQIYQPISVNQFLDDLCTEEDTMGNHVDNSHEVQGNPVRAPSLRSVLSDPISGAFLEDAVVISCGHSFGGHMLKKVLELAKCSLCNAEIDGPLIPNLALRAVASAIKIEDERRLFHNSILRKRRKEVEHLDMLKRLGKENGEVLIDGDSFRQYKGAQYPFSINEKVLIQGNRRTPEKFVGREAVITSQCLNGWYLLQLLDSGESVRLQYRSLKKISNCQDAQADERMHTQPFLLGNGRSLI